MYTEQQLTKLIEDVEKEFTTHLAKAEDLEVLAKAEEKSSKPEKKEEPKAAAEGEKPAAEAAPEAPAAEAAPAAETAPAAPAAEAAPAAPAQAAPAQDGHDYDAEDIAHLQKMYMSMSKGELMAHHDACRAALDSKGMEQCGAAPAPAPMGKSEIKDENKLSPKPTDKGDQMFNDKQNGGIEGAPPHNALGPKSPASDANGAKINKSEHDRRNGGQIEAQAPSNTPGAKSEASKANGDKMNKSEGNTEVELLKSELDATNTKFEELKKNYDAVAAFLTKLVEKKSAPAAKAITSLEAITKSEGSEEEKSLTKGEVHEILCKKSLEPSLKKADREAINVYYADGQVDIKGISHLLK